MTADDGRLYLSYISQGRDGPVYGRPQNMVDGTVRNTGLDNECGLPSIMGYWMRPPV